MFMTNQDLNEAWDKRTTQNSMVAPDWIDGRGKDSDFMTIPFDDQLAKTWERPARSYIWQEVTSKPIKSQQSQS